MKISAQQFERLRRVSFQERLLFTKHLATMTKAGIPITEALETLSQQTRSGYFREVIIEVLEDVKNGKSLKNAFRKYPRWFDEFYISMVEVGETSGTLVDNLEYLALQLNKSFSLRKKIKSAMIYPAIVLILTGVMGTFISLFILPRLVTFFESFDVDLPLPTRLLLFIATAMRDYGILIFGLIFALLVAFKIVIGLSKVKPFWHSFILKVPILGDLISYSELASFSRNLGTLIKSGVPIDRSLEVTSETLSNLKFRYHLKEIALALTKGKSMGEAMKGERYKEFPPLVSRMIMVGEKTGKLDETLLYLADFYEDEVDSLSKNLSTLIEPVLLIGIGLVVGFIALSIISPIYQLTGSIRR